MFAGHNLRRVQSWVRGRGGSGGGAGGGGVHGAGGQKSRPQDAALQTGLGREGPSLGEWNTRWNNLLALLTLFPHLNWEFSDLFQVARNVAYNYKGQI